MPKIFISYRRADSAILAQFIKDRMEASDIEAFVDTRNIDGAGLFPRRLKRAIEEADILVCLLGETTLESKWVIQEIEHAHKNNKVFIPVFQERYVAPKNLSNVAIDELLQSDGIHVLDVKNLYINAAMSNLANVIKQSKIAKTNVILPPDLSIMPDPFEWIHIPAGDVTLIGQKSSYIPKYKTRTFQVDDFYIAKYPITNAQYAVYVNATGKKPEYWDDNLFNQPLQPVVGVSWFDGIDYCEWLSTKIGYKVLLPTEQQWQRAAQGDDERAYPWGNEWNTSHCRNSVGGYWGSAGNLSSVKEYEDKGNSPYEVVDMVGNVWEWCLTSWETGSQSTEETDGRVLRGGSWFNFDKYGFRCDFRSGSFPQGRFNYLGFRISL